jgi:PAS domain S-box-containing protein
MTSWGTMPPAEAAYWLTALVSSTDDAIVGYNLDGTVTFWNPAAVRLFGYTAEEIVGRPIDTIVPRELRADAVAAIERIRAGEAVPHFETKRWRKDGSVVMVSVAMSPVIDGQGRVIGASAIVRDVSGRQQLDEAAYRLAAIVEWSDDAIVSKDLNGIVATWNRAAERLFGYTAVEMIGRSITTIIPPERLAEEDHVLSKIRAGETVDHFETVRRRKDGTFVDVALTVSPVRTRDGRVIGASKIARDITERKRLAEIQRRVAEQEERTRLAALEAENRRIQEASRIKSEFVANMSHELRTPLHSIIGFTEVWLDQRLGPVSPEYRELGDIVLSSARHLLDLINDILDVAKLESGRIEFHPEPIDLHALMDEVTLAITPMAAKNGVLLDVEIAEGIGPLVLDPAKLKQVCFNYLSNGVKFTPDGGRVRLRVVPDGDERFRIEVEDTGIGVPEDLQHKLFVDFQQLDPGASKRYQGTGLGLALTRRMVEAQGGSVGFRSEAGAGSTFFAVLPRVVAATTAAVTSPAAPVTTVAEGDA